MDNVTIIIDNVGRMIIGKINEGKTTKGTLGLSNPCVVNIQADQQTGQMTVQLLPFVFTEFIKNKSEDIVWTFDKTRIIASDNLEIEDRVVNQYTQIIGNLQNPPKPEAAPTEEPEVVKLFDDE